MIIALIICGLLTAALLILVLTTRTVLTASRRGGAIAVSLTIIGCGIRLYPTKKQLALVCGRYGHTFRPSTEPPAEKKTRRKKEKPPRSKKKTKWRLPFSIWVKIARAGFLFMARFMARVQYDGAEFRARPVVSNPALAGMAYGWGQAFYGIFPGVRRNIDVAPAFAGTGGNWSGRLTVSIKNRQIVYLVYRLARDLPIVEIIRHKFSKRGA